MDELQFTAPPDQNLSCAICHSVMVDPVVIPGCGHAMCRKCVVRSSMEKRECTLCRDQYSKCHPNTTLRGIIDNLKVKCPHCEEELRRGQIEDHNKSCKWSFTSVG